ncbi:Cell division protein FtsZ 1 [uncultured archaeon]|nr:Cell division protein FtsZ 1 [uncultured archaeon]
MGGGTGTGSAHVIAKAAKGKGAIVVGVVTMPFSSEGAKRMHNAIEGLELLKKEADTTIVIPNDKLLLYAPDLPLNAAFKASDLVLANGVKGIAELITKSGLVNVDFADVRALLEKSGTAVIGLGEVEDANMPNRAVAAAQKALDSPLLDFEIGDANKCLINITGGPGLTLGEAEAAVNAIASKISKNAIVKWGAAIDDAQGNKNVKVLVMLGGVTQGTGGTLKEIPQQLDDAIGDVQFLDE